MKTALFCLLIGALAFPTIEANAGSVYATVESARTNAGEAGYVLFIYPSGWDKAGSRRIKSLLASKKIQNSTGDAAILAVPIYNAPSQEQREEVKRIMGPLKYPGSSGIISYPAIVFYDKDGRIYSTIHGDLFNKSAEKKLAGLIQTRINTKKKQDELIRQAEQSSDPAEKARLLLWSSRAPDISQPHDIYAKIKSADPNNEYGCRDAYNFRFSIEKNETIDSLTLRLNAVLSNSLYSTDQKQKACASALGYVRRERGMFAGASFIRKYARTMHKLDPKSALGQAALVVSREWIREYNYGDGWHDAIFPGELIPVRMQNVPVQDPGTYILSFKIKTGRDSLQLNKVRLLEGSRVVFSDATPREVNYKNREQTYVIVIKKKIRNAVLEITYGNAPDKRSTWGDITVRKKN